MEAAQARLSLHLLKCHIVGNHMSRLIWLIEFKNTSRSADIIKLHYFTFLGQASSF